MLLLAHNTDVDISFTFIAHPDVIDVLSPKFYSFVGERNPVIGNCIGNIISYCGYWCINVYLFKLACVITVLRPTGAHAGSK